MATYEIGKMFVPGVTRYNEGTHYTYDAGGHQLAIFASHPRPSEVDAVRAGAAEFALLVEGGTIVLCYRFGRRDELPWSDAPYSWHLVPHDRRALPPPVDDARPEERALCLVFLIDATTGILRAMRQITWSPQFTREVHRAIVEQVQQPFDARAYDAAIEAMYARYATTDAMVAAARARTAPATE